MKSIVLCLALAAIVLGQGAFSPVQPVDLRTGNFAPPVRTVAQLPAAATVAGFEFIVTDAASGTSCDTGGGTNKIRCYATSAGYVLIGGGGAGLPSPTNYQNYMAGVNAAGTAFELKNMVGGPTGAIVVTDGVREKIVDIDPNILPQKGTANTFAGVNTFSQGLIMGNTTSPSNGQMWYDGTKIKARQNGVTSDVISASAAAPCSIQATFTGSEIANNKTAISIAPAACTLAAIRVISDATLTATFSIARVVLTSWTGTGSGTSIIGTGTKPVITAATKAYGTTGQAIATGGTGYSGWTSVTIAAGDAIEVSLSGVTVGTATKVTLLLTGTR